MTVNVISICCDAATCLVDGEPRKVASLFVAGEGDGRIWLPAPEDPAHVAELQLEDLPEHLQPARWEIRCESCGDTRRVGDLLGRSQATSAAYKRILTAQGSDDDVAMHDAAAAKRARANANLSRIADHGVSRLSISGLRRTLEL